MSDKPELHPGDWVDISFTESVVTAVNGDYITVQTAHAEYRIDRAACDTAVTLNRRDGGWPT